MWKVCNKPKSLYFLLESISNFRSKIERLARSLTSNINTSDFVPEHPRTEDWDFCSCLSPWTKGRGIFFVPGQWDILFGFVLVQRDNGTSGPMKTLISILILCNYIFRLYLDLIIQLKNASIFNFKCNFIKTLTLFVPCCKLQRLYVAIP